MTGSVAGDSLTSGGGTPALEDPAAFPVAVREAVNSAEAWQRLVGFAGMLVAEGELRGLIGPRELPRLWARHIVNSMAVVHLVPEGAQVADIGSGAGFPGIVLAIMRPDVTVTLVESMERRCDWLQDVIEALAIGNARVVAARAEELHGLETFDVVTARAVAPLDRLLGWSIPLLSPGGTLLALKGERAPQEVDAARKLMRKLKVRGAQIHEVVSPLDGSSTRVVAVSR